MPRIGKRSKRVCRYTNSTCSIKIWWLSMYSHASYSILHKWFVRYPYKKIVSKKNSISDTTNLFIFRFFFKIYLLCPYIFIPSLLPLHPLCHKIIWSRTACVMMFSRILFEQYIIAVIWWHARERPEEDRLNKSNQEIGEMRAPNISRDKGFFLISYCFRCSLQGFWSTYHFLLFNFNVTT